jgi:uncharacterized protein DUF4845
MKKQAGVSLIGMLIVASLAAFFLLLAFRAVPVYSEYFAIKKVLSAIASEATNETTVAQLRQKFDKRKAAEYLEAVTVADLIVTKEGGKTVLSMDYERRVPVIANISLVFEFHPTTSSKPASD